MNPLEAALLIVLLVLPFHFFISRQIRQLSDPRYLREHGVVIVLEKALDGHADEIGRFMGHPIWASVRFKGMEYRFDRVIPRSQRERIAPHELFLEPGLVYKTD